MDEIRNWWIRTYSPMLKFLWGALLLMLPITSFPLLAIVASGTIVNPASAIPLVLLVALWLVPYLLKNGAFPSESIPLLGFVGVVFVSCLSAFFLAVAPYKGQTILSRELRALITLAAGVAFYLVTTTIVRSRRKLIGAIKLINVGGALMLGWSLAQGVIILFFHEVYPGFMHIIHRLLSIRDITPGRVTGFAYEPSWLANQLSLLYFPIWLGMIATWRTIYKRRLWRVPYELLFILAGIVAIFLARSRIGLFSLLSIFGFLVLRYAYKSSAYLTRRLMGLVRKRFPRLGKWFVLLGIVLLWILVLAIFVVLAIAMIYLASQLDWRLEAIFNQDFFQQVFTDVGYIFSYQFSRALKFAERTAYWDAGLRIFDQYPILGVGLGNAGFFFLDTIPAYGWRAPEVVQAIRPDNLIFPNIKSLWIRLLAETGFIGFTFFVVWIVLLALRAWQLTTHDDKFYKTMGLTGLLGTIAILTEGFSLDTFGLPYMWILLGIISATAYIARAESSSKAG